MSSLNQLITSVASRLSLNIVRDGTQSAEGNRLRNDDIVDIIKKISSYFDVLPQDAPAVCESWGGASVSEPVRLNGEDSFLNLENILNVSKYIPHSCLYRGTQGFGYLPLNKEDQGKILQYVAQVGVSHFRIFDMMNDVFNITPSVEILKNIQKKSLDIQIEIAICVNSERDQSKRLRSKEYYKKIIQSYLDLNPDRIAIKDYSGLCNFEELKEVIDIIKEFNSEIKIAIHSHTEKSEILAKLLYQGATTVDVGMSAWAGGNAHSDYFKTLYAFLALTGVNCNDVVVKTIIEDHPIIKKAREIENLCNFIAPPYKAIRLPSHRQPNLDTVFKSKIAAGGIVAMRDMLTNSLKAAENYLREQKKSIPSEDLLMDAALHKMAQLWEDAGRPDTVTPGSLILSKAANILTFREVIYGDIIKLSDIPSDYKNLIMGRYGQCWGFDVGFGNAKLRKLFLIENFLTLVQQYPEKEDKSYIHIQEKLESLSIKPLYRLQAENIGNTCEYADKFYDMILDIAKETRFEKFLKPYRFPEPASIYMKAKINTAEVINKGLVHSAYGTTYFRDWIKNRLILLFMTVKEEHVFNMLRFKADGIISGKIEPDPRALFWRDTICAGNVRQAYQDLVALRENYPIGRMTKSNSILRSIKRRTLAFRMNKLGIENNFDVRNNPDNVLKAHKLIARDIVLATRKLVHSLEHCIASDDNYLEYKRKIVATVIKQASLDAINTIIL